MTQISCVEVAHRTCGVVKRWIQKRRTPTLVRMRLALILQKRIMLSLRYTIIKVVGSNSFTITIFQSLNIELNAH